MDLIILLISGLLNLGVAQNATLNVLVTPTMLGAGSESCDVVLSFFDAQSNEINSEEFLVDPGDSASLKLHVKRGRNPRKFYAQVEESPNNCVLSATLNINDPTGDTEAVVPLRQFSFTP